MTTDLGILTCLDTATGKEPAQSTERQFLGLANPGRRQIYLLDEEGSASVIAPRRQFGTAGHQSHRRPHARLAGFRRRARFIFAATRIFTGSSSRRTFALMRVPVFRPLDASRAASFAASAAGDRTSPECRSAARERTRRPLDARRADRPARPPAPSAGLPVPPTGPAACSPPQSFGAMNACISPSSIRPASNRLPSSWPPPRPARWSFALHPTRRARPSALAVRSSPGQTSTSQPAAVSRASPLCVGSLTHCNQHRHFAGQSAPACYSR